MSISKAIFLIIIIISLTGCKDNSEQIVTRLRDFNADWKFEKGENEDAVQPTFDDSSWRNIDLPHDWSIEDLPGQDGENVIGPFTKDSKGPRNGMANAHVLGGTGWYRKSFVVDKEDIGKYFSIYFEGAYMETDIWINGNHIKSHKHGYTSFWADITDYLYFSEEKNVLVVRVKNHGQNSRWYSGSGIYRNVKLLVVDPVHIAPWGTYITTPEITSEQALVKVHTRLNNTSGEDQSIRIRYSVLNQDGSIVSEFETKTMILSQKNYLLDTAEIRVKQPKLWSPAMPHLYKLSTFIFKNNELIDQSITTFGIRTLQFSSEKGFLINGEEMKLKGGCVHHDNGILGAVAIDRAEERRVELLKSYGFNAVRSSHYPPSEKFLEACDKIGLLVIDEAFDMWQKNKNSHDYHLFFDENWKDDFTSMILRDRNHPSIILWSIGNEIEERADSSGLQITRNLRSIAQELDPSRGIIAAINEFWDHPGRPWKETAPAFELLDVGGYNYMWWEYENDHKQFPDRIILGTESVPIHAYENWKLVEKHPYVIGDFVWTAMDYLGESGIGHSVPESVKVGQLMPWPWFNGWCGDIDLIGDKKPQSFYRDVVWGNSIIEMAVHAPLVNNEKEKVSYWGWPDERQSWNWDGHEGKLFEVNVYTQLPRVRLELNDKMIGEKELTEKDKYTAKFTVPFEPGKLKAIGLDNNGNISSAQLITSGKPHHIKLTADRETITSSLNDLSFVKVEIMDEVGQLVPDADILISFNVEGAGALAAAGSAHPSRMTSFRQNQLITFRGKGMIILQPSRNPGQIKVNTSAVGLQSNEIIINII